MASTALRNEPDEYVVPTYESDYAGWAFHQAMLVRSGQFQLLDRAWVAEELDGLARQEFDRLASALRLIMQHMLKWDFQIERRSRNWTVTIGLQRDVAEQQIWIIPASSRVGPKPLLALIRACAVSPPARPTCR